MDRILADMIQREVNSVGYQTAIYNYPFTFGYTSKVDITVQLTPAPKEMEEVIVTTPGLTGRMGNVTMSYTVVKGQTITEVKKESMVAKEIKPPVVINEMLV